MKFQSVRVNGTEYTHCLSCKRFGRAGWAHKCGSNWYVSVEALEAALANAPNLIGTVLVGAKPA